MVALLSLAAEHCSPVFQPPLLVKTQFRIKAAASWGCGFLLVRPQSLELRGSDC
jgi:hypothetical protein